MTTMKSPDVDLLGTTPQQPDTDRQQTDELAEQERRADQLTSSAPVTPRRLEAAGVSLGYGGREIVSELSLEVPTGQVSVIIGANGCGKSTLLRGMARLLNPTRGAVLLDGKSVHSSPSKEIAKVMGGNVLRVLMAGMVPGK